jgi:GntR family transcriptional regulator
MMTSTGLDIKNEKPLYLQLAEAIKARIAQNVWSLGMMIPSENELAEDFNISVGTVKKALSVLVQEGALFRRQGKGTFVTSPDFSKSFSRFFRYDWKSGESAETPGSKVLSIEVIQPDSSVVDRLQLDPEQKVFWLKRVRTIQNKPFVIEDIFLPFERFKGLELIALDQRLLYPIYNEIFSTPVIWADEYLQPAIADQAAAEILGIQPHDPVMCVERIAYTYQDVPIEWRRSTGRGDTFRYHIVVK